MFQSKWIWWYGRVKGTGWGTLELQFCALKSSIYLELCIRRPAKGSFTKALFIHVYIYRVT
jgi:hypothetical protein